MTTTMEAKRKSQRTYLPGAGLDWLLPLYDPLVKVLGGDPTRKTLLDQAKLRADHRVLEIGCGTGSLLVLLKQLYPEVDAVGLDPDPKALARARRKAERAAVSIRLDRGFSDALPYPDASFDRVLSSFMLHHLPAQEREQTLYEVRRVLVPGGTFHVLDFGGTKPDANGLQVNRHHVGHGPGGDSDEQILAIMRQTGFADAQKTGEGRLLFGRLPIAYYRAG